MKTKRLIAVLVPMICLVLTAGSPCHAQLFGGGGLLGGGGGFGGGGRLLGGGGRLLGGGGFGGGGGRPILGGGAPIMRPSRPIIRQPIARPGFPAASRPVLGGGPRPILGGGPARPVLGNRPVAGSLPAGGRPIPGNGPTGDNLPANNRPALGDGPLAGNRPIGGNLPAIANRPVINAPSLPGVVRPSQPVDRGRLDDFLSGADRPAAGQLPGPGIVDRPAPGGDRPIGGDRPGPGGDRPILGDRPGIGGDRPILGNRPILDRPIMPNLGEQILGEEIHKEILGRRVERAVRVRDRVRDLYYRENHPFMYWRAQMWAKHPVWSWWRVTAPDRWANWSSVSSWCGYSGSYAEPVTYEYTDQGVYANDKEVVVNDEYSRQARELATAGAQLLQQKIDAQEADKLEWLPIGVYALCKSDDGDPTMFLQITISREAIVAGSFADTTNNENLSVQGGADRESARLAFTIGNNDDVVIETGLYNLTEEQSSALVHYQDGTRESWLLVKTEEPKGSQDK